MLLFNFHHHNASLMPGIYNLGLTEAPKSQQFFSAGLHPYDVSENWHIDFLRVQNFAKHPDCLAVGECGLDATIQTSPELQAEVLKAHFELANDIQKPVIIHCVRRFEQLVKLQHWCRTPLIIHGFRKSATLGKSLVSKGFYLSFGSALLQNVSLQALLAEIPVERVFMETDTSDLDISLVYAKAAEIKNMSIEEFAQKMDENLKTVMNG